ncbi:hypothetical protein H0H93_004805 [Arthromyces matolae]|nr:hypothetical protein H0H93_004805 [Arthromyces matolae]
MRASERSPLTDSPLNFTREKQVMSEIKEAIAKEIYHKLNLAPTNHMLTFFPEDPQASERLTRLTDDGTYTASRWKGFPEKVGPAKVLYGPFAHVSNAIVRSMDVSEVNNEIFYVDIHDRAPTSLEFNLADGRPDGAGIARNSGMIELENEIRKLEQENVLPNNASEEEKESYLEEMAPLRKKYKVWWMQIHVAYEANPREIVIGTEDWFDALSQLLSYMRLMLIEQLDRRFVLGFLLCNNELTLVLCDRSGIMVADTPINIHADPKTFIRVMTGFSRMTPEQLGWDTTMKIYCPISGNKVPSYEVPNNFDGVYDTGRYDIHWIFSVIEGDKQAEYVTISIASPLRSPEICSRATFVFEVVKFEDRYDPTETFALKRYWRPIDEKDSDTYPSEGHIYKILDDDRGPLFAKHALLANDIIIDGEIDSTLKLARRSLKGQRYERPVKPLPEWTRTDLYSDTFQFKDERRDLPLNFRLYNPKPSTLEFVDRHHAEILMPMGEPIIAFCNRTELLKCFLDFIEDHEHAHNNRILHRDISMGNLLIFTDSNGKTYGRLMDYDHAKKASGCRLISFSNQPESDLSEILAGLRFSLRFQCPSKVDDNVMIKALQRFSDPVTAGYYIAAAVKVAQSGRNPSLSTTQEYTTNDLGWKSPEELETINWPNWEDRESRGRTGTLPYISAEVLTSSTIVEPIDAEDPPFIHQAIHDMESFLWVLVCLCLTRSGPGIHMKREFVLDPRSEKYDQGLIDVVVKCFEGTEYEIQDYKRSLLLKPAEVFEKKVVARFHPYFEPLKPYVVKWWSILQLGYKYRGYEFYNIYSYIKTLLKEAIAKLELDETENDEATIAANKKMDEWKQRRFTTFSKYASGVNTETSPFSPPPPSTTPAHLAVPRRPYPSEHSSASARANKRIKCH